MKTTDPLPLVSADTRFFWESGRDGVLRILRCDACGEWSHPPYPRCPVCERATLRPSPTSGNGTVYSFTICPVPAPDPALVIAIVELDEQEGLRLTTNITDVEADDVHVGQRVSVHFTPRGAVWLPMFRPIDA